MRVGTRDANGVIGQFEIDTDDHEQARQEAGQAISDQTKRPARAVLALIVGKYHEQRKTA